MIELIKTNEVYVLKNEQSKDGITATPQELFALELAIWREVSKVFESRPAMTLRIQRLRSS